MPAEDGAAEMGLFRAMCDAFAATLFTWFVTAVGAALVFVLPADEATQRKILQPMLGFAGGVMTSAAFFSLLAPALEMAEASYGSKRWAWIPVTVGFSAGGAALLACDRWMERHGHLDPLELMQARALGSPRSAARKHVADPVSPRGDGASGNPHALRAADGFRRRRGGASLEGGLSSFGDDDDDDDGKARERKVAAQRRAVVLLVVAITLHNFPEGLAVGVGFGGAAAGHAGASRQKAWNLAVGIGLQNFPEGLAVSMPLRRAGMSPSRAFLFGQLSGIVEPVGGVLGAALVMVVTPLLPYALAFAAGAMIYVVVDQLIPESLEGAGPSGTKQQTLSFMGGFCLMMTLDVALG